MSFFERGKEIIRKNRRFINPWKSEPGRCPRQGPCFCDGACQPDGAARVSYWEADNSDRGEHKAPSDLVQEQSDE